MRGALACIGASTSLAGLVAMVAAGISKSWDASSMTIISVCSIDPEVYCWDMTGAKAIAPEPFDAKFRNSVEVRKGWIVRLVNLEIDGTADAQVPDFDGARVWSYAASKRGQLKRVFVPLYVRNGEKHGELVGRIGSGKPVKVPFGFNQVVRSPGHNYAIAGVRSSPIGGMSLPVRTTTGKTWTIACRVKAFDLDKSPPMLTALDCDGISILAVSPEGHPILVDPQLVTQSSGYAGQSKMPSGVSIASIQAAIPTNLEAPKTIEFTTNIDPSKIKHLRYFDVEYKPVKITGIPLQPSRS
jgi:hypothetical protein